MFDPYGTGFWKNKHVLVTGGASFIGSHLVEKLLDAEACVRVADDFSSGKRENLLKVQDTVEIFEMDLRERTNAERAMDGIEVVFHLAAAHGGRGYIDTHPVECSTNMILDGVVFAAAHKADVERISFTSSACVYPAHLQAERVDGNTTLLKETDAHPFETGKANADLEYGWAKLMGEMTLKAYHRQYGMKGSACRFFTVYGERENETHAIIALIAKAFVGQDPFEVWGNGKQDRNFTYVGDIVEGIIRTCERVTNAEPVNIGTDMHVVINDAIETIFNIIGFRPKEINHDLTKPVGVFSRAADLVRSQELLGWVPQRSFEDGVRKTIEWYRATHDKEYVKQNLEKLLNER